LKFENDGAAGESAMPDDAIASLFFSIIDLSLLTRAPSQPLPSRQTRIIADRWIAGSSTRSRQGRVPKRLAIRPNRRLRAFRPN
jgi:hypothetical protein